MMFKDEKEDDCPCSQLTSWTDNLAIFNQNIELACELYNQLHHRLIECELKLERYEKMMDQLINKKV
jgi:hypothetical protein